MTRFAVLPWLALTALLLGVGHGGAARTQTECLGAVATIVGTAGDDELTGTAGRDVIAGLGGSDTINGGGGDDLICGGADHDLLDGQPGNDRVDGGPGGDLLVGDTGNDDLLGGEESVGTGFTDEDFVSYLSAPGPVRVSLADGQATGWGTDRLVSVEQVFGSDFADTLVGDDKANLFWGSAGNDEIRGGGGSDTAFFGRGVTASLVTGRATGEGSDRLAGIENLQGSDEADRLTGNGGTNTLSGGFGGRDVLVGGGGGDVLLAGGPSRLTGGAGNDLLAGYKESDALLGGAGDDALLAHDGDDTLSGGAGDDLLSGERGNDAIDGGTGGGDTADYLYSDVGVRVDLSRSTASGAGQDRLGAVEGVLGSAYDDVLVGDSKANALMGTAGDDRLVGGVGADFLDGGGDRDDLDPGAGTDYCLQDVAGCEISGIPEIPGAAPPPPGTRVRRVASRAAQRSAAPLLPALEQLARDRARAGTLELRSAAALGFLLGPKLLLPQHEVRAGSKETAGFRYAAEPVCFALRAPYSTEIAPPRKVDPVVGDARSEEAWWQGTLYRARGNGYAVFRKTAWARAQLSGPSVVPGVAVWKDATGRRVFPGVVKVRVPAGRYVWKGNIYWTRSGGQVFAPVEPHIIRARTIQHNKQCVFR